MDDILLRMAAARKPPDDSTVELRVVTPDDWQLWRVVRLQALAEAPYAFSSSLAEWRSATEARWRDRLTVPGGRNYLAWLAGAPVGMASGVPGNEPGTVDLMSMYVAPAVRGRGVADALLEAVESWGLHRGASRLCLAVRANNLRARRVYERHGLVLTGEAPRSTPAESLELVMCKDLVPGAVT